MCFPMSGTYDSNHYYLLLKKRKRRLFGCCFSLLHQNPLLRSGSVCAALISHCFPGAGLGAVAPMEPYLVLCKQTQGPRKEGGSQGTHSSLPGEPQAVRCLCWTGNHPLTPRYQRGWVWPNSFTWSRTILMPE